MPSCIIHLPAFSAALPVNLVGTPVSNLVTVPTLPAHVAGQIIVVWLYRRSSAVTITKSAATASVPEWFDIDNNPGANGTNSRSAWALASGSAHTLGTWTNAEMFVAAVFENQAASPIGGHAESGGVGTSVVIPALTLSNTDGTSAVLHLGGSTTNPTWAAAPAGYTRRTEYDSPLNVGGVFLNTQIGRAHV